MCSTPIAIARNRRHILCWQPGRIPLGHPEYDRGHTHKNGAQGEQVQCRHHDLPLVESGFEDDQFTQKGAKGWGPRDGEKPRDPENAGERQ